MKTTIDMAKEAGIPALGDIHLELTELKAFEALVRADERNRTWTQEHWTEYERSIAAAEREACAKLIEAETGMNPDWQKHLAAAIRNRGQA